MAIYMKDKKSEYYLLNTLAAVLEPMIGKYTVVDLRNEASVRGKVSEVDGYMNMEMVDCIFQNPRGEIFPFPEFFVSARNIRYVHLPANCTTEELIEEKLKQKTRGAPRKLHNLKTKRAKAYQQDILQGINQASDSN